jgi:hypothetical protein
MDEKSDRFWKKSRKLPRPLRDWLILVVATFFILLTITHFLPGGPQTIADWLLASLVMLCVSLVIATVLLSAWWFIRWLFCWHNLRRFLFALACLATSIALFYAEEDWRGKHDWEQYQGAEAAKGERFDWQSVVPPPVPDDRNFAFSPVWIAEVKYNFLNTPKRAEDWYGDRIYDADVVKLCSLFPVSTSGLVGTNWFGNPRRNLPPEPVLTNSWQVASKVDLKPWQTYYRTLQQTNPSAEIPVTPQPQTAAKDILLALSKFDPVIERLRTDSTLPDSRFPLTYDQPDKAAILLPHLAALKRQSLVLQLRSLAELDNGQPGKALADIHLILRLADAVHSEPFIISQLVRTAIFNIALQPIWEGVASRQWSDQQLAILGADLADWDFLSDYGKVLRSETGFHDAYIQFLREHPDQVVFIMGNYGYDNRSDSRAGTSRSEAIAGAAASCHLVPSGWFYQNELGATRAVVNLCVPVIDTQQRTVAFDLLRQANATLENERMHPTPFNFMENLLLPALGNLAEKFVRAQTYADLARIAIALERYRLAHGAFPESPDVLSPQFISELPHDVINGQPMKYRREINGQFVLYSVGWNETDDGGVVVLKKGSSPVVDLEQGDWVWRYPDMN